MSMGCGAIYNKKGVWSASKLSLFSAVSILFVVSLMYLTFAIHNITTSGGGSSFSVNEDVSRFYNISVNNTDPIAAANISQVNITIPSSFTFTPSTNGTTAPTATYTNTSTVLSWLNNTGLIMQNTTHFFFFNATAATPGTYNITITTRNFTGSYSSNLSVTVNDTTSPDTISFVDPTLVAFANVSGGISVNVTATDNAVISAIVIRLFNSSGLVNTTSSSTSPLYINFTGLVDGVYYVNATVNDTFNFANSTSTRTFTVDNVAPSISMSCTPDSVNTDDEVTCSCSATDNLSGVSSGPSFTTHPSTQNTGSFTASCSATDYVGNTGSGSDTYIVESSGSNRGSSGSGSGSSGSSGSSWSATYSFNDENLDQKGSVSKNLGTHERISIKINDETHHVGVLTLTSTSAEVEVSSTPQTATLNVGESQRFDINDDSFYDMNVTLVSIDNGKANLTVQYMHDEVVQDSPEATFDASSQQPTEEKSSSTSTLMWIILGVLVVVAVAAIVVRARARRHY